MQEKIAIVTNTLENAVIVTSAGSMCYNVHLIKKIYFRHGMFKISQQWENILRKMHELVVLRKIRLSKKLSRFILYARTLSLVIGLMLPTAIIDMLGLKLNLLLCLAVAI